MKESEYCYVHNPKLSRQVKKKSRSKGGKANRHRPLVSLPEVSVCTPADVLILLEETINQFRSGQVNRSFATAIGYLSGPILKAYEIAELDKRLKALEGVIASQTAPDTQE